MTKVFIAGSRRLSRLNAEVKRRIDTMIEKDFTILVGDANGADKAVQRYLAEKGYRTSSSIAWPATAATTSAAGRSAKSQGRQERVASHTTQRRIRRWLTTLHTGSCYGTVRARVR